MDYYWIKLLLNKVLTLDIISFDLIYSQSPNHPITQSPHHPIPQSHNLITMQLVIDSERKQSYYLQTEVSESMC